MYIQTVVIEEKSQQRDQDLQPAGYTLSACYTATCHINKFPHRKQLLASRFFIDK